MAHSISLTAHVRKRSVSAKLSIEFDAGTRSVLLPITEDGERASESLIDIGLRFKPRGVLGVSAGP